MGIDNVVMGYWASAQELNICLRLEILLGLGVQWPEMSLRENICNEFYEILCLGHRS